MPSVLLTPGKYRHRSDHVCISRASTLQKDQIEEPEEFKNNSESGSRDSKKEFEKIFERSEIRKCFILEK